METIDRRVGQSIRIGPAIEIKVVDTDRNRVQLGVTAPREVAVWRAEIAPNRNEPLPQPPDGVKLYAFEFGALWPLAVKTGNGWGGTLGYAGKSCGPLPRGSEIEIRYEHDYPSADKYADTLERAGHKTLVIKGMPRDGEVAE